ncbi:ATP-dependent RNA helicase HrpA [Kangiella sp. HZ709]|uniref:ATP-dependent RNA helicase HrpA n=1 Tax=Kangiella sp. HZ709 TaxID=2666328 RepID=UPI0012AF2416|nr:ATP-dependent RNA helicase HrpA [Kangiella sp. HZ709]MRX26942.1 ATP-dependent RNA helicase HrpA [Kangiella sp. HZ709]
MTKEQTKPFQIDNKLIKQCLLVDQLELKKLANVILKRQKQQQPCDKLISKFKRLFKDSSECKLKRQRLVNRAIKFDDALPISNKRREIAELITNNQVIVVAGETGSGKTTQLPKICLELGYGIEGRIGHTQPRRVAATSVARRIAEELETPLGETVGYSIRFNDQVNNATPIRIMTDGILLNEITHDPLLQQYQVIIIDEAHERSLNIDFLLGYLKNLLPKRPDLKIIITSATIDLERFSNHFKLAKKLAPVIEVSGRTYPVDVWYRPADEENPAPQVQQVGQAVEEIMTVDTGDILIFLSGEAEIREAAKYLRKEQFSNCQVLPLYARLSITEQEKIFKPSGGKRRIVLATNVAETSVTVPGIRFVIDPGFARISRYSVRNKIQRLPIEKISQASANQRKGRCGRVSDGICIRLYSEEDFDNRSLFTDAEILRTNLASVILQMQQAGLGDVEEFPFLDQPAAKQISDGQNLLIELQAIDPNKQLTSIGKQMARLPIEPRLARILLEGQAKQQLNECLVIAAFLSVKDPREWPFDKKELAHQKHRKYLHSQSDFIAIVNLWVHLHQQQSELSNKQFKDYCRQELINPNAYREWRSTYRQLKSLLVEKNKKLPSVKNFENDDKKQAAIDYRNFHQCLLAGLISFVGQKDTEKGYLAARQTKYFIHPQSTNFKKQPAWLMAFEVVETTQAYARLTAFIEASWIEDVASHLLKTHYYDAYWSKSRGTAIAPMQQTLFGLKVVVDRKVDFSKVDPGQARSIFILHGLVRHELNSNQEFFLANEKIKKEVEQEIAKARQANLRIPEKELVDWFEQKLPTRVCNAKALNLWLRKDAQNSKALQFNKELLLGEERQDATLFPETINIKSITLPVKYHFEPGHKEDGVTVIIPSSLRNRFSDIDFERLVPGLLEEKIQFLIRSMPKRFRKNFLPVPHYAKACYEAVIEQTGTLKDILSKTLYKMTGVILTQEAWAEINLPEHLSMRYQFVNDKKKLLDSSRTLEVKTNQNKAAPIDVKSKPKAKHTYTDWDFDFKSQGQIKEAGTNIPVFYAIEDAQDKVRLIYSVSKKDADKTHLRGVCRLIAIKNHDKLKYLIKSNSVKQSLSLGTTSLCLYQDLVSSVFLAQIKLLIQNKAPSTKASYNDSLKKVSSELVAKVEESLRLLAKILKHRTQILANAKGLSNNFSDLKDDINEQLDYLFVDDFSYRYGVDKYHDYLRYLQALTARINKAKENLTKENQAAATINPWLDMRIELEESSKIPFNGYLEFLWMLEEFRISLFSQGQKTQFPISAKRLEKIVDKLNSKYQ